MHIPFNPQLLHIYGSVAIQNYGLFIALGIGISMWLIRFNKRFTTLHLETSFTDIVMCAIMAGIVGGRTLEIASQPTLYTNWIDYITLWQGGFSALGSIIGVTLLTPFYIKSRNIPILPLFDLVAIYAPLMQSIARLGCFVAGCCHGAPTTSIFSVIYTHPDTIALANTYIHPTQLYSSLILFCIFLYMFYVAQHLFKKTGQLFTLYLVLAATERFLVDFWRDDHLPLLYAHLSFHQIIALLIAFCATIGFVCATFKRTAPTHRAI